MSILIKALHRVTARSASQIEKTAKEIIAKFFPDTPVPDFKIVNNTNPKWLGQTEIRFKGGGGEAPQVTVKIQKAIVDDEKTMHRVLCHELIHVRQYHEAWQEAGDKKENLKDAGHGRDFKGWADKMNAAFGKDYVTEKSDQSYTINQTKEYYVVIEPHERGLYGVTKVVRPSGKQKEEIKNRIATKEAHIVKTKDRDFGDAAPLKKYGGFSVYKGKEIQKKLAEMYEGDNEDRRYG